MSLQQPVQSVEPFETPSVEQLEVGELTPAWQDAWDTFVDDCPEATFFHRAGWKTVIEKSFGHACPFLFAHCDGSILGILPLVHIDSRLFGKSLVSSAFCVYGGVATTRPDVRLLLEAEAECRGETLGVDHVEYRLRSRSDSQRPCKDGLYVTFRQDIDPDLDVNMKRIPRKQRAMVRKGISNGLTSEIDADVDRFYALYSESVRNLGTPVFSKRYPETLMEVFGSDCEALIISDNTGRPVNAVLSFYFRDEVLPYYGGGGQDARRLAANDFMYWEVMRRACERGYRLFDFGRSKVGTGAHAFKKNWGFEPAPLYYEYRLYGDAEIPDVNPLNPKYQRAIKTWQKLPLAVANRIGPFLAKNLG